MESKYRAEYRTVEGCNKLWISTAENHMRFPPQVSYGCDLCDRIHSFRHVRTYTVTTAGQARQFDEYCEKNKIEKDVSIDM